MQTTKKMKESKLKTKTKRNENKQLSAKLTRSVAGGRRQTTGITNDDTFTKYYANCCRFCWHHIKYLCATMRHANVEFLILLFVINLELCHFPPFSNCTWNMANVRLFACTHLTSNTGTHSTPPVAAAAAAAQFKQTTENNNDRRKTFSTTITTGTTITLNHLRLAPTRSEHKQANETSKKIQVKH